MGIEQFVTAVQAALADEAHRVDSIKRLRDAVHESSLEGIPPDKARVLRDLAYDLEFYEPDARLRSEAAGYYGDEAAVERLTEALRQLD